MLLYSSGVNGQDIKIRYVANMGVMVTGGENRVLFDALHDYYGDDYLFTPWDSLERWYAVLNFDAAFISHTHGDHFDPRYTMEFLRNYQEGLVFAPEQAGDSLFLQGQVLSLKRRVHLLGSSQKPVELWTTPGFSVTGYRIPHANRRRFHHLQNISWLLTLDSRQILHLGDAAGHISSFKKLAKLLSPSAVIIVPYWIGLSEEGRAALAELQDVDAKGWVFTHFPPMGFETARLELQTYFPSSVCLVLPGQVVNFTD